VSLNRLSFYAPCTLCELCNRSKQELPQLLRHQYNGWDNGPRPMLFTPLQFLNTLRGTTTSSSAPTRAHCHLGTRQCPEEYGNCLLMGVACQSTMCQYSSTSMPIATFTISTTKEPLCTCCTNAIRFTAALAFKPVPEERISTFIGLRLFEWSVN